MRSYLLFLVIFLILNCSGASDVQLQTTNVHPSLQSFLGALELGDNGFYDNQYVREFVDNLKTTTSFPCYRIKDMFTLETNSKELLPSEESLNQVLEFVKDLHQREYEELIGIVNQHGKVTNQTFSSNGVPELEVKTVERDGYQIEAQITYDETGEVKQILFNGKYPGCPHVFKTFRPDISPRYEHEQITYSYNKAGVILTVSDNLFSFSIAIEPVYKKTNQEIEFFSIPEFIGNDSRRTKIYSEKFGTVETYYEAQKYHSLYNQHLTVIDVLNGKYQTFYEIEENLEPEVDYDVHFEYRSGLRLVIDKFNLYRQYENGRLITELDLETDMVREYQSDGSYSTRDGSWIKNNSGLVFPL